MFSPGHRRISKLAQASGGLKPPFRTNNRNSGGFRWSVQKRVGPEKKSAKPSGRLDIGLSLIAIATL